MSVKLRHKILSNGSKSFYLDIYQDGKRKYEFLKLYISKSDTKQDKSEKKQLAESIRAKRELQFNSNEYGFIPSHKKNIDFLQYYQKFLDNYKGKDHRLVKCSLDKFKLLIPKSSLPAREVNEDLCEKYKDFLKNPVNGLSGETPHNYLSKFKRVLKQAVKDGILLKNPCEGITIKRDNDALKKNVLEKEELQKLANNHCGNPEVKRAFLFACFTGLGIAEIRQLTWSRINNNKITLFREKNKNQIINDLPPVALKLLGQPKKPEEKVFSLPTDTAISKNLKVWVKRAKIDKKITFYCGRHTFATQLLSNNAKLETVADAMGHKSTRETQKYVGYADLKKSEAISKLPDIDLE